ncbi:MAG: hypothetical protein SWY16_05675 [Cyanobacteriota bacterium]|nr:hypothetical protein [Cyanobacteriota bacterium]
METLVAQHVEFIDGIPYTIPRLKYGLPLGSRRDNLYVHPETGILSVAKKQKIPSKKRDDVLEVDRDRQYHKIDNVWYLVTFAEIPYREEVFDILLQRKIDYWTMHAQYRRTTYAVHKRHCTKKEIKQIVKHLERLT